MATTGTFTETVISPPDGTLQNIWCYFKGAQGNYSGLYSMYAYGNGVQHFTSGTLGVTTDNNNSRITRQITGGNGVDAKITGPNDDGVMWVAFRVGDDNGKAPTTCEVSYVVSGNECCNLSFAYWISG